MGTSRKITESQLERAKSALAGRVTALTEKKVEKKKFKHDPVWRKLDARVRQIAARLRKVAEVETNNADVIKHKEDRIARVAAEKAELKASGGKKAKPEKEKGKGDAKAAKKEKAPKKEKGEKSEKKE
ncbi:MAG TPA: hypothetical protein VGM05_34635 [Planctomycetaceae bacterium]|jgi:hypothetical protein